MMAFFKELEAILLSQDPRHTSAADALVALDAPNASIAILEKGNISAHNISTLGADSDTLFQAASISKPMAAMVVFKAVQSGHLSLDTPISTYLSPDQLSFIQTPKTADLTQHITIEMLLSHTSGLSVPGFRGYSASPPQLSTILRGEYPSNSPQVRLEGLPGHEFSYSGGGFTVLELILETVFQKPFPEIMQESLFTPLNMRRSFYVLPPAEKNFASAYFTAHTPCNPPFHIQPERAAAGLWTTPSDLLRVVSAVHSSLQGSGFLEPKWAKLMLSEVSSGMARGWRAPRKSGAFTHGGSNDPGYRCLVIGYNTLLGPDNNQDQTDAAKAAQNCGICIMTNSALGTETHNKLVQAIAFLKNWPLAPATLRAGNVPFASTTTTIDTRWREWAGKWGEQSEQSEQSDPSNHNHWTLLERNGLPILQFKNLPPRVLRPAAIPPHLYPKGNSIDLVIDGLYMMLRLGWKDDNRILELWNGDVSVLERGRAKEGEV